MKTPRNWHSYNTFNHRFISRFAMHFEVAPAPQASQDVVKFLAKNDKFGSGCFRGNQDRNLPIFGCGQVKHGNIHGILQIFQLNPVTCGLVLLRASSLCTTVTRPGKGKVWPGSFSVGDWSNCKIPACLSMWFPKIWWIYWGLGSEGLPLRRRSSNKRCSCSLLLSPKDALLHWNTGSLSPNCFQRLRTLKQ